jgi:hypothetical protein
MESLLDHFPVFQANQVLMSQHLNDVFDYLDQQERQTRSHLIGIGIVCGLEISLSGSTISLTKGCGVTSEGYLIVVPLDESLVACRTYTLPSDIAYSPFSTAGGQYALWELFEDGVPNTTRLDTPAGFLDDKAVLLFLELRKDALRNCSPNNCDDKGSQVTATVRRLLIARSDLDKIIAAANNLGSGLTATDLDAVLSARLNLPDLRLRRFGVIDPTIVTSNDLYTAFLDMVRTDGLAQATADALSAAYAAFRPLLAAQYPNDPFTGFDAAYGFLDSAPENNAQVVFLQYYADLFDDLLRAYDEFRWSGLDLICACCPDDALFPRHLMLGLLKPGGVAQPAGYRQGFLASPATGDCAEKTAEVVQLFARLVAMTVSFTNTPSLPPASRALRTDPQIRITPSTIARDDHALDRKAIPYYYAQKGKPPLYQLWSPVKTRRNRANQNFSYNADLYANPPAPAFVTDPLRYDIEPYDFLRIEGHLGKDYQAVMQSLLTLRSQYRLPIDVIALRTGLYDDTQPVDPASDVARFQDLEALYGALRGELMSALAEGVMQLYDKDIAPVAGLTLKAGTPGLPLLQQYAPHYSYAPNTVGSWYEFYLTQFENQGYLDIDQNAVDPNVVLTVYCTLFNNTRALDATAYPNVVAIYYISKLAESVPPTLDALDYANFENKYQDLMSLIRYLRSDAIKSVTPDLKNFLPEDAFIDICEGILFDARLDAVKAVHDEYAARVSELKKRQFISTFLQSEPGIQHKAGVPPGGTFIVVYHGMPQRQRTMTGIGNIRALQQALDVQPAAAPDPAETSSVMKAIGNIAANRNLIANDDINLLIGLLTRPTLNIPGISRSDDADPAGRIIDTIVNGLANGIVIADFFLPYRVSGGSPGIQYVLPKVPPSFTVTVGCTATNGNAAVSISAEGGSPPYDIALDGNAYEALTGPLQLTAGNHEIKLRDNDGSETLPQTVTVAPALVIGEPVFECAQGAYTTTAPIVGGTPPYQIGGGVLQDDKTLLAGPTQSGTPVSVTVTDSLGCTATTQFTHECPPPCTLPCAGIALNRGFRFFLPDPDPSDAYEAFELTDLTFTVEATPGNPVDLSAQVRQIIKVSSKDQLTAAKFPALVNGWLTKINKVVASTPGLNEADDPQWLTLAYKATAPGRLGVLSIEYFQCLKFDIQVSVGYALASGKTGLHAAYTPEGTTIRATDTQVTVPAFDGVLTDKCQQTDASAICPAEADFTVQIAPENAAGATQTFSVTASVPGGITFLWEAQDGDPPMGNGAKFKTQFATSGSKLVTVTGFNANGCSATSSQIVKVG